MKKYLILPLFVFIIGGCDDSETNTNNNVNNNTNSSDVTVEYSHTGCKGTDKNLSDYSFSGFECVYYNYDEEILQISHVNAIFNCCPDETLGLTGDLTVDGTQLTLTESDNGGNCNCVCPYDLSYDISGLENGSYTLGVEPFSQLLELDLNSSTEDIVCIDRLLSVMTCDQAGDRGCPCTESSECMGGDGYCLEINSDNVCVNSCETTEDCPVPELEECIEDSFGVKYCNPLTIE
ncbi:MAG: hypothetical protein JXR95_13040 [Deltaproteobacteria bacterium]|nr:hypothetical protein [Deltaproteobacteria bacterium]